MGSAGCLTGAKGPGQGRYSSTLPVFAQEEEISYAHLTLQPSDQDLTYANTNPSMTPSASASRNSEVTAVYSSIRKPKGRALNTPSV